MAEAWVPTLYLYEQPGGCRLSLGGWVYGDGQTLQDAADDLVNRLVHLALKFRANGLASSELGVPDRNWLEFVWEIGEAAVRGEDPRARVFGIAAPDPEE